MKKVFLYLAMTMAFVACGGGDDSGSEPIVVSNDYISVSTSSIQLPGDESEQELKITANCNWSVSSDVDWISVSPSFGNGNSTVIVSASLNSTGSERMGTVTVRTDKSKLEKKIKVTQGTPTGAIVPTINDNQFPE